MKLVKAAIFVSGFILISATYQNCANKDLSNSGNGSLGGLSCSFNSESIANGSSISAFVSSTAPVGSTCLSESRVCSNGDLSGSYQFANCQVGAPAACLFNGQTIQSGAAPVTGYLASTVPFGSTCQSQPRTCTNGSLSGTYQFATCTVGAPAACLFNGQTIPSGTQVLSYFSSTVPFGSTCQSQPRTCTNGVLSGTYRFASCKPNAPASCLFNGVTVPHMGSIRAYKTSTVPFGSSCLMEDRQCMNGVLSTAFNPAYSFDACAVGAPASCQLDGQSINSGNSIVAYLNRSETLPQECQPLSRTCTNGMLSGSANYQYSSCASLPAVGPTFANGTYIPVLTYHSWQITSCDYATNVLIAFEKDLEIIYDQGFTIIPGQWAVDWYLGRRAGSTMPEKPVVITFDDGLDNDYFDPPSSTLPAACPAAKSLTNIMRAFKARHSNLPSYSPHATSFVIASQKARDKIGGARMSDNWWLTAENSGFMSIQNHSTDHDHGTITTAIPEPTMGGINIPLAGYADGIFAGQMNFYRITTATAANYEVVEAAKYIQSKIGKWPAIFAYPFGHHPSYLENNFFPNNQALHKTDVAFCIGGGQMTKASPRWCVPRWVYGEQWTTEEELPLLLNNASVARIFANSKSVSQFTLRIGTPFNLRYQAWGATRCDLSATKNGAPWYEAPNNGVAYDWGQVVFNEVATFRWTINCPTSSGGTVSATTQLNMVP